MRFLSLAILFIFIFYIGTASAQQGSIYISAGYNEAWYNPTTIHVEQGSLNNSYDMLNVKGDNHTNTPISAAQLNYRIGYYCNWEQNFGFELSFDPVNYRITDGQNIHLKGYVNDTPNVSRTIHFSSQNGYYYYLNGANLMLFNIVKRFGIYRSNSKKIGVDCLLKVGGGPVLPHFQNSLPINPVDDPKLQYGGWNAAGELALRVTVMRHFYLELAGKYDYANLDALNVTDGTAQQKLTTYEAVGSIGFTFPTTKYNPLFYHQTIITIIPLFVDQQDSENNESQKNEDLLEKYNGPLQDIPEFDEIVDKRTKEFNDSVKRIDDSLSLMQFNDSMKVADSVQKLEKAKAPANLDSLQGNTDLQRAADSMRVADSLNKANGDNKKHKKRRRHKDDTTQQATAPVMAPATTPPAATPAVPPAGTEPPPMQAPEEKPKTEPVEKKEATEQNAKDKAEQADKQEKTDQTDTPKKESKKERKKREKEEKKERKKKEKEEKADKDKPADKPAQDNNDQKGNQ